MSGDTSRAFDGRIIGIVVIAGIIGFLTYLVLNTFAPQLSSGRDGGSHAMSHSAVSYSAIAKIARDAGRQVSIERREGAENATGLLIFTPSLYTTADELRARIEQAGDRNILIIPPKWAVSPQPLQRDRVQRVSENMMMPTPQAFGALGEVRLLDGARSGGRTISGSVSARRVTLPAPRLSARTMAGRDVFPVLTYGGETMLGYIRQRTHAGGNIYILADADLLNNQGIATPDRAVAALRLLDALGARDGLTFDVVLNGLGGSERSLLRLAMTPPFLGLTICLLAAALLAIWQGFVRFGPAWREQRAVALGKSTLVANGARLIVQARRVPQFAPRYVALVREAAARALHAPSGLEGEALDGWLDRFPDSRGRRFSSLAQALLAAHNPIDCVTDATALGEWRKDVVRGGQ
jgi:hypothetical protein